MQALTRHSWLAWVAAALVLSTGMILTGVLVRSGLVNARTGERVVSVKGLAECEVQADLAIWPLRFVATSNDLAEAQTKIQADATAVRAFLTGAGIADDDIEMQSLEVTDLLAQAYRQGPVESRFIITQTLAVRSSSVETVVAASQRVGDLVEAGVILGGQGPQGPYYLFTGLNDIKPAMLAEATANARAAAEQFAEDSGSRIDGIRSARQGVFQILARDKAPGLQQQKQVLKTVRIVSTIDYALEHE